MYSVRRFCRILYKSRFSVQIFIKFPNVKFQRNPCKESRGHTCGETDRQRRTDMAKLIHAFHHHATAPKIKINLLDVDSNATG
jgi:hypothetical protein